MGASCSMSKGPIDLVSYVYDDARRSKKIESFLRKEAVRESHRVKVLLLGTGESGKSTIVKQMKIIHLKGFTEAEMAHYICRIRGNLIDSMVTLVNAMDLLGIVFEKPSSPRAGDRLKELAKVHNSKGKVASYEELGKILHDLWADKGIQRCFGRSHEYQLIDSAGYFLSMIDKILAKDFRPSSDDILRTRVVTTGISEINFSIKDMVINMIDVGGQRSERKRWIRCFNGVQAVIFVASLSEYDQVLAEDNSTNRMQETLLLFGQMCEHPCFIDTNMILFLNKKDLFAEKLHKRQLTICFPEYQGPNRYREASMYIWEKFEEVKGEKTLFSHVTCATDTENLKVVFVAVTDMLVRSILGEIGVV